MATKIGVIIPAFNEEQSIGLVINAIPEELSKIVVVGNNGSTDQTAAVARKAGAVVADESRKGYGNACLAGMAYLKTLETPPEIVVFLDGDFSDFPGEMTNLIRPIAENEVDLVIGSRVLGNRENGALLAHQRFGNWLAVSMLNWLYRYRFTDLGPFRAIRYDRLMQLDMQDRNFGWTVEMQVKAAKHGLKCTEVPVSYRKRVGTSKVSGTIKGSVMAGYKIIGTILREKFKP
ncbi:MAG: glycosyltransferase family 2 protein [Saprospiraceae bacterium]|nr:glycosyltransferase family 2 protein [Saprospiraceae bacterium]